MGRGAFSLGGRCLTSLLFLLYYHSIVEASWNMHVMTSVKLRWSPEQKWIRMGVDSSSQHQSLATICTHVACCIRLAPGPPRLGKPEQNGKKKWHVASLPVMSLSPVASADQTLRPVTARESEGRERFRGFGRRGGRGARKDPLGI